MKTALLDIRGLMLKSYHASVDPEALQGTLKPKINTAAHGIQRFIEFNLNRIMENYGTPEIIAVWDGGNDRRRDIFPEYKYKRHLKDEAADPLEKEQLDALEKLMKKLLAALGIIQVVSNTQEADDVIAKLCATVEGTVEVFTIDGDLLALSKNVDANGSCTMVNYDGEIIADERNGLPHHLITLNKALVGDASDEYKGVKGFGPAKWDMLVEEYGLDGCEEIDKCFATKDYSLLGEVDVNKALQLVIDNLKDAKTCYNLALLHPEWVNTPFRKKITKIIWHKRVPDKAKFSQVLEYIGALDLLEGFEDCFPDFWLVDSSEYEESDLEEFLEAVTEGPCVAFDYETYDPEPFVGYQNYRKDFVDVLHHEMSGVSFCFGKNYENCFYLPTQHKDSNNLPTSVVGEFLKKAEESNVDIIAHSAQFEIEISERCAGYCPTKIYDTQHMKTHVDEDGRNSLKALSKALLNYDQNSYRDTVGDKGGMNELTAEEAAFPYGCDDSLVTAHLFSLLRYQCMEDETWAHYAEHSPNSERTNVTSRRQGVYVDKEYLDEYQEQDAKDIEEALVKIHPLLEAHCTSASPAVVNKFLAEDFTPMLKAKNKAAEAEKKLTADQMMEKGQREYERCLNLSIYEKPFEGAKSVAFLPTKAKFKLITDKLELEEMDGVTSNRVSNYLSRTWVEVNDEAADYQDEVKEFLTLLGAACSELKDREGPDYDNLTKFCEPYLVNNEKTIKTGTHIDIASPKFMQTLLYCMLQLPINRRSKVDFGTTRHKLGLEGSPSTDVDAINYAIIHDLVENDWRKEVLENLKIVKTATTRNSLYFKPYAFMMREVEDGHKLFPTIRLKGTVTRRPTGTAPNVLQISSTKDDGRMRKGFLPAAKGNRDRVMVCIDFSQQELRILASETRDPAMIACYVGDDKKDIHTQSAVGIYNKLNSQGVSYQEFAKALEDTGIELNKVAKKIRKDKAKPTNFLVGYGGSHHTLSQRLMIPESEAKEVFDAIFETYPGIGKWQESTVAKAKKDGFVATAYGNKRHARAGLFSKDRSLSGRANRQLCNSQIQGCAADILDEVMSEYWLQDVAGKTGSQLIAPVYDEIVASVPVDSLWKYVSMMVDIMEVTPPNHIVPMVAEVSIGWNWGEQHEIGETPTEPQVVEALHELLKIEN